MPTTDLQFLFPFRDASGRASSYAGTVTLDLAPVDAERVLTIRVDNGLVDLRSDGVSLYEEWRMAADVDAGEPADRLPSALRDAFERLRAIRTDEWASLRLMGDTVLSPVRAESGFAFSATEGGAAVLSWLDGAPGRDELAVPLSVVAEFAYLDPAADIEFIDHGALARLDAGRAFVHSAANLAFADSALRTMARGLGCAAPDTIRLFADAVAARTNLADGPTTDAGHGAKLPGSAKVDEMHLWLALRGAMEGMRQIGQPDGEPPAPHAERLARTVGAEMRSNLPVPRLAEAGLAASFPRHPLTLLRRLHDETADWEYALSGERPSLVEARCRASDLISRLPVGQKTLFDVETGESVEEALDELVEEARDWAHAMSGERPSLDALLAQRDVGSKPAAALRVR